MKVGWLSVWVVVLGAAGVLAEPIYYDQEVDQRIEFPWNKTNEIETQRLSRESIVGRPVDCADYFMAGFNTSGVYEIYPFTCTSCTSVMVWCDMETDGGGWTVFLNRQNQTNQLNFNRTWDEYKEGFGSPGEEYWLGNELLHLMTFSREYAIRLDIQYILGYEYATYERFTIDTEDNRYRATVSGVLGGGINTTNCLEIINSRNFMAIDSDYDSYSGNCAAKQGGGWWYYNCSTFNPTTTYNTYSMNLVCGSSIRPATDLQIKIRPAI